MACSSPCGTPCPSSFTSIFSVPFSQTRTSTTFAPASKLFSNSSFTAVDRVKTTCRVILLKRKLHCTAAGGWGQRATGSHLP